MEKSDEELNWMNREFQRKALSEEVFQCWYVLVSNVCIQKHLESKYPRSKYPRALRSVFVPSLPC